MQSLLCQSHIYCLLLLPCSHARGYLVRRQLQRQHAAAATIQRSVRGYLARKRAKAVSAVKRQMVEMARLLQEYQRRSAAAARVQAAWRGHQGRCEWRRRMAALREAQRLQQERAAAALAVIAPWAQTFRDRLWFRRARRAAPVLQAWWRREFQRRQAAAVTIQTDVRRFLAQRQLQRSQQAAVAVQVRRGQRRDVGGGLALTLLLSVLLHTACAALQVELGLTCLPPALQTAWRGFNVRATHPHRKQLADIRLRLAAAAANAGKFGGSACWCWCSALPTHKC